MSFASKVTVTAASRAASNNCPATQTLFSRTLPEGEEWISRGQSLSACYRTWKARGRPASRRTSSTVDVLALRHPLQWNGGDGGTMAKDETASKRSAEKIAHANARYTLNLLRAFGDLLPKLKRAYGEPAGDAAVTASVGGLVIRKSVLSRSVCGARIRACRLCGRWAVYSLTRRSQCPLFSEVPPTAFINGLHCQSTPSAHIGRLNVSAPLSKRRG